MLQQITTRTFVSRFIVIIPVCYMLLYAHRGSKALSLTAPLSRCQSTALVSITRTTKRLNLSVHPFNNDRNTQSRIFSVSSSLYNKRNQDDEAKTTKKESKKQRFKVVDNVPSSQVEKNLAAAFDALAMKEGFDSTMSFYADDDTFEDDFVDFDDIDFDMETPSDITTKHVTTRDATTDDFMDDNNTDDDDDMDARIAAAQIDASRGRVSVPETLDEYANKLASLDLRNLGFRREINPFGNDETPRREKFLLNIDAMKCSGCGSDFQCTNEQKPGYLPPEKFEIQVKYKQLEEIQKLQEKDETNDWSTDDEVEWLLRSANQSENDAKDQNDSTVDKIAAALEEELGLDSFDNPDKKIICKRCHSLTNHGTVDILLRPGWSKEPLLSQENFRNLLRPLSKKNAVIVALVDLFDFAGSVLPELDTIAGDNPVIIAANKVDLLPSAMGPTRIETWIRKELYHIGIQCLSNNGGYVQLVSCKTGMGVEGMLDKARRLAEEIDGDIYIIGAANSGKSTLMNRIVNRNNYDRKSDTKIRPGNKNKIKDIVTTSPLPGTTLKFISADMGGGRTLYDTPGLLVPGTLTQLLTPEELKIVVPREQVEPVTFRVPNGKCVLIGGLAKLELIGDSKPFLFTFFVANAIKLHPTDSTKASEFLEKHVGGMLTPPLEPGLERYKELSPFEEHVLDIEGNGWKQACADIALTGLGWVAVTGAGIANVKITVPKGLGVELRPPLMPFDIWESTAKYTGSRSVRKSSKTTTGKRRKGVGRN